MSGRVFAGPARKGQASNDREREVVRVHRLIKLRVMPLVISVFLVTLFVSACRTASPAVEVPIIPGSPITQEEVEGNAKWSSQYERFFNVKREGAIIPGLKQGFIPQGMAYLPENDWILISGYREKGTSLVTIIDAATGILVKTVDFANPSGTPYTGHAGGVAVSDRYLWISSGNRVHYVELSKVIAAPDGARLRFAGSTPVDARASFVRVADNTLWVGDFAYGTDYETSPHHHLTTSTKVKHSGWIAGYPLDPATGLIPANTPRHKDGWYIPQYALSIPDKIQGVLFYEDLILLTESYGRNNASRLHIYRNPMASEPEMEEPVTKAPVWFLDETKQLDLWTLTPMVESVIERNGEFHINFESAALKYINGSYALSRLQVVSVDDLLAKVR